MFALWFERVVIGKEYFTVNGGEEFPCVGEPNWFAIFFDFIEIVCHRVLGESQKKV